VSSLPVSVVIATRDRPRLLADALASIAAGATTPDEVLVVDQSREDATSAVVAANGGATYVRAERPGLSAARNQGARAARNEIVAFCDDDVVVSAGWLAALRAAVGAGAATGRVERDPRDDGGVVPALVLDETAATYTAPSSRDVLAGGNMAIRRDVLASVGWFDERLGPGARYPAAEDNDLGWRLLAAGHPIAYEPAALVYHRAWRRTRHYPAVRWRYGRGKGGFYAKAAGDNRYGARRAAADLAARARRFPWSLRHPVYATGEVAYAVGVVIGAVEWLVRERGR
jgi:GT2 family glycosyltransferase